MLSRVSGVSLSLDSAQTGQCMDNRHDGSHQADKLDAGQVEAEPSSGQDGEVKNPRLECRSLGEQIARKGQRVLDKGLHYDPFLFLFGTLNLILFGFLCEPVVIRVRATLRQSPQRSPMRLTSLSWHRSHMGLWLPLIT